MNSNNYEFAQHVTLKYDGTDHILTITDGRAIAQALEEYLRSSAVEHRESLLAQLDRDPWIGPDKTMRLGAWILESDGTHPVLTYRPEERARYRYKATFDNRNGRWKVSQFGVQRILSRH